MVKKKAIQAGQLSLFDQMFEDFETQVDTAVNLNKQINQEEIRDERATTTVLREEGIVDRNDRLGAESSGLPLAPLVNSGSLGTELARETPPAGSGGRDFAHGSIASPSENGAGRSGRKDQRIEPPGRGGDSATGRSIHVSLNDYRITTEDRLGDGGPKAKFYKNIDALNIISQLRNEGRGATPEEQAKLVQYSGWGGLSQAFDGSNADWQKEFEILANTLSRSDYEAARRSTLDSHYTPPEVIDAIYAAVSKFGVGKGKFLEPSVGIGHFIGKCPEGIDAQFTAIELDPVSAAIATNLYPKQKIINRGFHEIAITDGQFDVVIGNPPFGEQKIFDPDEKELSRFSIHNYFLAKSVKKLAPGGIAAFVVSSYFMDAQSDEVRRTIDETAEFIGAIRLPNSTFKKMANTEVVTDIVFFQKREFGTEQTSEIPWTEVAQIDIGSEQTSTINKYFIDHPEMVLGKFVADTAQFGRKITSVELTPGIQLHDALSDAVALLPEKIYKRNSRVEQLVSPAENTDILVPDDIKIGGYFMHDGQVAMRLPDSLDSKRASYVDVRNKRAVERIAGMILIRDSLRELMHAERTSNDDYGLNVLRARLNKNYDQFVKKYGFVTAQANRLVMQDDSDYPLLASLESEYDKGISAEIAKRDGVAAREPTAKKADIFTKRVCSPIRVIESVASAKEALVVSMNETGGVSLDFMRKIYPQSPEKILTELEGLVFKDPVTKQFVVRDKYLSGNVKEKLRVAEAAAEVDRSYQKNVSALRDVLPADIDPVDISVQMGSTWVPEKVYDDFVTHLLGDRVMKTIQYQPVIGKWNIRLRGGDATLNTVQWGTAEAPATDLIESIMLNRPILVQDFAGVVDGKNTYKTNVEKTAVANMKADEIKQAFIDWIWDDETRRLSLAKKYNELFNTNVPPVYDGSHLTLPGASLAIQLRPSQKNFIWRGIQEGGGLADHEVGAGKTFALTGLAMESRRMGLLKKPAVVVPNHMLGPWKDAFYKMYPDANVLVAEKEDFKKENRQRLFGRIATGDWDAVIIAHSSFKKIGMPEETLNQILEEQIDDLTDAILKAKSDRGDRVTIKEMEKTRDRMKEKLKRVSDTGSKDKTVTFDELGIDALFVDEADEFKNLFISTSLNRISGLGNIQGSEKAFDLFVKCRYLQQKYNGRGVYFATGTPIANSVAELFTMQRYQQYDELKKRNIHHFDAWASTFGKVVSGWELDATGVNYKMNSRFSKFQNVPELINMYRTFADVISNADLIRQAEEAGKRFPIPKIKGGKPTNIIVDRSPAQSAFMGIREVMRSDDGAPLLDGDGGVVTRWNEGSIIHRMENLPKDPRIDNPLKITNDARKAGLDFRLINPGVGDFEGSKVNALVNEVIRIYHQWDEKKGTQLIFCDLSTPKGGATTPAKVVKEKDADESEVNEEENISMDEILAGSSKFNVYDDVKAKLHAAGIPLDQIAFIHDAKTEPQLHKLYDEMNRGDKRILMGSTQKMGAGTNVQRLLTAIHHLDCPWRPRDLTQRNGRGIRQGNALYEADPDGFEFEIIRYSTKQMYDARMWQVIEYKAAAIEQFRRGDILTRVIDDVASEAASAAEMKAAATGNVLIFAQVQIQEELKKQEAAYTNYKRGQYALQNKLSQLESAEEDRDSSKKALEEEIRRRNKAEPKILLVSGQRLSLTDDKDSIKAIFTTAMASAAKDAKEFRPKKPYSIGAYRGFDVYCYGVNSSVVFEFKGEKIYTPQNLIYEKEDSFSLSGFFQRIDNTLDAFESRLEGTDRVFQERLEMRKKAQDELGKPFAKMQYLEDLRADYREVMAELRQKQNDEKYVSNWKPRTIELQVDDTKKEIEEISAEDLVVAEAKRIHADYLHAFNYRPEAERIFASPVHKKLGDNPALYSAVLDLIETDLSFGKAIIELEGLAPAHAEMRQFALAAVDARAKVKEVAMSKGLTTLFAKGGDNEYGGPIVMSAGNYVLQDVGNGVGIVHSIRKAPGLANTKVGEPVRISYKYGNAARIKNMMAQVENRHER